MKNVDLIFTRMEIIFFYVNFLPPEIEFVTREYSRHRSAHVLSRYTRMRKTGTVDS